MRQLCLRSIEMPGRLITVADFSDTDILETVSLAVRLAAWLEADGSLPNDAPFGDVLAGCLVHLAFFEPSTRTRISFETAAKLLGADTVLFTGADSSIVKGESLEDTAHTLLAMCPHLVVVRHPNAGSASQFQSYFDIPVVNGGDGRGHHPTQALLDIATVHSEIPLWEMDSDFEFLKARPDGEIDLKPKAGPLHLVIVGDIRNSRVARSNAEIWTRIGHRVTLIGPKALLPVMPINDLVALTFDFDEVIPTADVIMMLRMQKERQTAYAESGIAGASARYALTESRLDRARPDALILHPGPCNRGTEIEDAVYRDPRCRIRQQVRFGVAVRMAVLAKLLERRDKLCDVLSSL